MLRFTCHTLVLLTAAMLLSAQALADPPARTGDKKHGDSKEHGRERTETRAHAHFAEHDRAVVHQYYVKEFERGHCPPGLARKHNGCLPPGQAKKWRIGHPLPREVVFYDLPPQLVVEIGVPPPGYRYVRVASDILMIAAGTGMVVDAIEDLGRM